MRVVQRREKWIEVTDGGDRKGALGVGWSGDGD